MSAAKGEVGRPLLVSLAAIWFSAVSLYLVIDPLFEAHKADVMREYGPGPTGYVSIMTLSPGTVVLYGVLLSVLFAVHWWFSGLFGKAGSSSRPIANSMLVMAGLSALLEIFEHGAMDFYDFSLFCGANEPTTVILVDEVYRCERSLAVRKVAQLAMLMLPILAIPVRILELRLKSGKE